jgi:hypothetical protein
MGNDHVDDLPPTTDCLYCHNQSVNNTWNSWGAGIKIYYNRSNQSQYIGESLMYGATTNDECYSCHTSDGSKPKSFHAAELIPAGGDECDACHDVGSSVSSKTINLSAFNRTDVDVGQNIGKLSENRTLHGDINQDGVSNNSDCQVCHYNITGMGIGFTVKLLVSDTAANAGNSNIYNTYYCSVCHYENTTYDDALNVISTPADYPYNVTDIGDAPKYTETWPAFFNGNRTPDCETCHNNSVVYYNSSDSVLKRAAHYGKYTNLTTIGVSDENTTQCAQCHRGENAPGGAGVLTTGAERLTWGVDDSLGKDGGYLSSNDGNAGTGFDMFGTSTPSARNYCYACHLVQNAEKTVFDSIDQPQSHFHSAEVTLQAWNCNTCH